MSSVLLRSCYVPHEVSVEILPPIPPSLWTLNKIFPITTVLCFYE